MADIFKLYSDSPASAVDSVPVEHGTVVAAESRRHFQPLYSKLLNAHPSAAYVRVPSRKDLSLTNRKSGFLSFGSRFAYHQQ